MMHLYDAFSIFNIFQIFIKKRYYTYEKVEEISKFIKSKVNFKPLVAIICGSGLGNIAHLLSDKQILPYDVIPEFPRSTGNYNRLSDYFLRFNLFILNKK